MYYNIQDTYIVLDTTKPLHTYNHYNGLKKLQIFSCFSTMNRFTQRHYNMYV